MAVRPHEIALLDLTPVLVEPVHGLALEDVGPGLHHVGLREGDDPDGEERHDGQVHVVAQVRAGHGALGENGASPAAPRGAVVAGDA